MKWKKNIRGIQGGRRPDIGECPKPTVIHCSSGGNQREVSKRDILHKLMYADDLAVVADSEADLQEWLIGWKEIFGKHGLRVSLEKMEVLWVGCRKKI